MKAQLDAAAPEDRRDVAHAMLAAAMGVNIERHGIGYTHALAGLALNDAAAAFAAFAKMPAAGRA